MEIASDSRKRQIASDLKVKKGAPEIHFLGFIIIKQKLRGKGPPFERTFLVWRCWLQPVGKDPAVLGNKLYSTPIVRDSPGPHRDSPGTQEDQVERLRIEAILRKPESLVAAGGI